MKNIIRYICATVFVAALTLSTTAWAGECCKKAAEGAKAGTTCAKCEKGKCCKDAAAKVEKDGKATACAKCAKAKDAAKEEKKS